MTGLSTGASGLWGGNPGLLFTTGLSTGTGLLANLVPSWVLPGAVLDLYFANSLGFNSANPNQTTPNSILTYTAPSPKLVYGSTGVLGFAPHNRIAYSDDLSNAAWSKTRGSATTNKFSCDSTADASHSIQQNGAATANVNSVFSVDLKGAEITTVFIQVGGAVIRAVNLSTGALGAYSLGTSTASIVAVDDGYYRVTVKASPSNANLFIFAGEGDGSTLDITLAGVRTGEGFFIRRAQFSYGVTDFTYIPTTTAAVYSLPIDYNPTTFASLGVLIEEQRVNLLTYSEQFDTTWAKTQATVTANSTTAPDGTTTADTLLDTAVSNIHYISQTVTGSPSGVTYTVSTYLKASTLGYATVGLSDISSGSLYAVVVFNLSSGTVATSGAAGTGYSVTSSSITSVGNGWYRCVATVVAGTSVAFLKAVVGCNKTGVITGSAGGFESYLGNGSGVFVWGAQLEAGAFATSYIPTVASQVTRAADQVSILTSAFGYNAAESTLVVDYDASLAISQDIVWIANGLAESLGLYANNVPQCLLWCRDGGVTQAAFILQTMTGTANKVAAAWKLNDFAGSLNGAAVAIDNTGTMPTPTELKLNPRNISSANGNIRIKRLTYFPTRRTDADLQVLTT